MLFSNLTNTVDSLYKIQMEKYKWGNSPWENINKLELDYIGKVGENLLKSICNEVGIICNIDGTKNKLIGGGNGDGFINNKTIEIKTSRLGKDNSFQHELGETPWNSNYMVFIDITPNNYYLTIFENFSKEEYKKCCKCVPYFPTRSFCWRKHTGCFKFNTTLKLNETQSLKQKNTIKIDERVDILDIKKFINKIII